MRYTEATRLRCASSSRKIGEHVRSPGESARSSEDHDGKTLLTYLCIVPPSATKVQSEVLSTLSTGTDEQPTILLMTIDSRECLAAGFTAHRKLILVPSDLPSSVQGLWCSSGKHEYIVYARKRSPEQLVGVLYHALALVSGQDVAAGGDSPARE